MGASAARAYPMTTRAATSRSGRDAPREPVVGHQRRRPPGRTPPGRIRRRPQPRLHRALRQQQRRNRRHAMTNNGPSTDLTGPARAEDVNVGDIVEMEGYEGTVTAKTETHLRVEIDMEFRDPQTGRSSRIVLVKRCGW